MDVDSNKQKAVLFAYTLHPRYGTNWVPVKLQGLDASKTYTVKETNLYPGANSTVPENNKQFTGDYLMTIGLNISQSQAAASAVIEITAKLTVAHHYKECSALFIRSK